MADAITMTLKVDGLEELDAMLRALPEEVAGPIMRDALTAAGGSSARQPTFTAAGSGDLRCGASASGGEYVTAAIGGKTKPRAYAGNGWVRGPRQAGQRGGWEAWAGPRTRSKPDRPSAPSARSLEDAGLGRA